jgi:hypothetical protein
MQFNLQNVDGHECDEGERRMKDSGKNDVAACHVCCRWR